MSAKKITLKPRNHIVLAMIRSNRTSGPHGKTGKALRRGDRVNTLKLAYTDS